MMCIHAKNLAIYVFLVMLGDIDGITKFDNQSPLLGSCSSAIEESL